MLFGVLLSVGAHVQSSSAQTSDNFSMIISSDTQYPWTARTDAEDPTETEEQKKSGSITANQNHLASMNALAQQVGNVKGMILNGDITAYGHDWQLDKYKDIWKNLSVPIYAGLGNHDYANNIKVGNSNQGCYQNGCGIRMVEYIRDEIRKRNVRSFDYRESNSYKFPEVRTEYIGSLAYSWDIGNVHFVQLHNYPTYQQTFEGFDASAAKRKIVRVKQSLDWLEADLTQARNEGKAIVLNYHDSDEHWKDGYDEATRESLKSRFANILKKYDVSAVFVGHYHGVIGKANPGNDFATTVYGSVPVFYSGSASQSKYLLARFQNGQMTVEKISSANGGVSSTSDGTYALKAGAPSTPIAPAPKSGALTFFNEGGYVARYKLTYTSGGKEQSSSTGNLALGNKKLYELPADATNISIRGEVKTGLLWEPWRDIFNKKINHPRGAQCYKTYGTTLNAKWNNSCS